MNPDEVFNRIGVIPYMRRKQGWMFYEFITRNDLHIGLELGFFHGASTAYIAGAIADLGSGMLTTVDRTNARKRTPNVEQTLEAVGLSHLVKVYYEPRSFNWRLMKLLEEDCYESFDFCYIDGGHNWYDTGFASCLVERLLKPGGWVVFDDLYFSQAESSNSEQTWVKRLPLEEQFSRQVERVFSLLVEANPYFGSFRRLGCFAFAQKKRAVWSHSQRAINRQAILLSRAFEKARSDPEFRDALVQTPSETLASYSGLPAEQFHRIRIIDSDSPAPVPSQILDSGETMVYLESPRWDSKVSEARLEKMLQESSGQNPS